MTAAAGQHWLDDQLILDVRIQPRASRNEIVGFQADGRLKIRLTQAPVDDQANSQLLRILAKTFAVNRGQIKLLSGHKNRNKRISIDGPATLPAYIQPPGGLGLGTEG